MVQDVTVLSHSLRLAPPPPPRPWRDKAPALSPRGPVPIALCWRGWGAVVGGCVVPHDPGPFWLPPLCARGRARVEGCLSLSSRVDRCFALWTAPSTQPLNTICALVPCSKAPSLHDCFTSFVYGLTRSPHISCTCLACRFRL